MTRPAPLSATVVVCTRDRPVMLARLLASLQEHVPDVDVLVVDSASATVETREVAAAAGVPLLRLERPGLSIARNAGVQAASGDVVVFTDDDCLVRDRWLDPLVAPFADPRVGVVTGEMVDLAASDSVPSERQHPDFRRTVQGLDLGHGANMAFRRSAVLDVGGFDERLGAGTDLAGAEDLDMFCRLLHAGWTGKRTSHSRIIHAHVRQGAEHTRLIRGYARGSGAALAKWLRIDRTVATDIATVQLRRLARQSARALRRPAQRQLVLAHAAGLVSGFIQATRMPVTDGVFVPAPAPISAGGSQEPVPRLIPLRPVEERFLRTPPGQPEQVTTALYVTDGVGMRLDDGQLDTAGIHRHITAWGHSNPHLMLQLATTWHGLTPPVWVTAAGVPGSAIDVWPQPVPAADVDDVAAALQLAPLDVTALGWHVTVLDDPAGPVAFVIRGHHAWTDGAMGLRVLSTLTAPEARPLGELPVHTAPPGPSGPVALPLALLRRWWGRQPGPSAAVRSWRAKPLAGRVRRVLGRHRWNMTLARHLDDRQATVQRAFTRIELPLTEVRSHAKACGGNINELLVVATAHALRATTTTTGSKSAEGQQVTVPMSDRGNETSDAGNRVRVVPVTVDVTADPATAVPDVRRQLRAKELPAPEPCRAHATTMLGPRTNAFLGEAKVEEWALLPSLGHDEEFGVLGLVLRSTLVVAVATSRPADLDSFSRTLVDLLRGGSATADAAS
ncbi:glycosyltransferase [Modestobacter sp. VKM Ac-2977]|uniref:glycosyltransferase n=1 Tax=Modestobacter sp. VKM Ac-2977 TaxID=3004131 RepID=UPI0022AAD723|nr:glycosyltransferase [Modestobacter sp. VKM Ac-2977]MCZ2822758.1 glycosyltransferase [Modestobacter sp. VKM Ac-2977]